MDFKTLIEGKELDARIERIHITDRQGAQADDLKIEIVNDDHENIYRGNDIEGIFGGFKSGKMHIDKISSTTTKTLIGAISAPINAKEKRCRHWRKVRLFDIVNDVAIGCGVSVFYENVKNIYYENVTQYNETDLAFLNRLCIREGYSLKIDDERIIIYDVETAEASESVYKIGANQDIEVIKNCISFSENPNRIRSVTVKHYSDRLISCTAESGTMGEKITIREYVGDEAEAERFARGYLRYYSQNDITVDALIPINDGIASGNCVDLVGYARYDGKYFIYECCHDPKNNQSRICGRKIQ